MVSSDFDAFDYWINLEPLVPQYIVLQPITTEMLVSLVMLTEASSRRTANVKKKLFLPV